MTTGSVLMALSASTLSYAANPEQSGLDAGALQQQIDKEVPEAFTRALPTPGAPLEQDLQLDQGVQVLVKSWLQPGWGAQLDRPARTGFRGGCACPA